MPAAAPAPSDPDDRTGRARIRDAAIGLFGERGVDGTSLKLIAEAAGVSQPLIVHHFGSKDGLRVACDEHVAASVRASKLEAMSAGSGIDPMAALRSVDDNRPLMRYLARTLTDGSPHVAALVDEMVADAVEYMAEGERTGAVLPSEHPRERAVVLTVWSLGLLALSEHVERLLGVDVLGSGDQLTAYILPALEILSKGVVPGSLYEQMRDALENEQDAPA
jgi:AcrR family transcriptional regulator